MIANRSFPGIFVKKTGTLPVFFTNICSELFILKLIISEC